MPESDSTETTSHYAVTDAEIAAMNSTPAVYANKFYVTSMDAGMRIAFGEVNPSVQMASFRSAVFLSYQDATMLADLLANQLAFVRDAIQAASEQAGSSAEKP